MGFDRNLIILGAGPGGYVAAIRAASLEAKVTLIEQEEVGGTCLNKGCIPTKAILSSLEVFSLIKEAEKFGISICDTYGNSSVNIDLPKIIDRKNKIVNQLAAGIKFLLKKKGVELINGRGVIKNRNEIEITNRKKEKSTITGDKIIIATGSKPVELQDFPFDGEKIISSNEALELREIPEGIVIIGGGVIGLEFATIFNKLGTKVTIVEMLQQILPTEDFEIAAEIRKILESNGVTIITGKKLSSKNEIPSEKILVAIGRIPNSSDLGLENAGVKLDGKKIIVDEYMKTNIDGIFAIGDVTGKLMLAHVASHQAIVAAENSLGGEKSIDYSLIPNCIFTDPEIASVGLTETKAKEKGLNIKIGKFPFSALGKAICMGRTKGFVKIIADKDTERVYGVHIIGPSATSLIAEASLAIKLESTLDEFINTVHAHPTLPESLMEASFVAKGSPIHI